MMGRIGTYIKACAIFLIFVAAYAPSNSSGLIGDCRQLDGLSISASGSTVTASTSVFSAKDVGKKIIVFQAGVSGQGYLGNELIASITAYNSPTSVSINKSASVTVSNVGGWIGTDNSQRLLNLVKSNSNIEFPPSGGSYMFVDSIVFSGIENVIIDGNGVRVNWISANPNSYPSPGQPEKHLFNLISCTDVAIKNFKCYNIGQDSSLATESQENGYVTNLNSTDLVYQRWWNKQANTGVFVNVGTCENVTLENIELNKVGGLFNSTGVNYGGKINNCVVNGSGATTIAPATNMIITNCYFNNSESPAILSAESQYSTTHFIYTSAGNADVTITNNTLIGCRGTAIQWNTGSSVSSALNVVANNKFQNCARAGSLIGSNDILQIAFTNNTYDSTGVWTINQGNGIFSFTNETWHGDYAPNCDFCGAYQINNSKAINITGCNFYDIGGSGNKSVIFINGHVPNYANINIVGNQFDTLCNKAIAVNTDFDLYTGAMIVSNNVFRSSVELGLTAPDTVATGGINKFIFTENIFIGTEFITRYGCSVSRNSFFVSGTNFAVTFDLKIDAGQCNFTDNHLINSGGSNMIELTTGSEDNNVVFFGCIIDGASSFSTNGNSFKIKAGNFFSSAGTFDSLPI